MIKNSLKDLYENFEIIFKNRNIENLFITNDMRKFGLIEDRNKNETLEELLLIIKNFLPKTTIIVPTANLNLPNSGQKYDNADTASFKMGAFSEFIRKKKHAIRSFHPLWSMSGLGKNSKKILSNISSHAYSANSVVHKLFQEENNYFLALGQHPRFMLPIIHHLEHINQVPYRFEKTFTISCRDNEKYEFIEKQFQLDVLKDQFRENKRACNSLIFNNFESKGELIKKMFNNTEIYLFNFFEFYELTNNLFKKDINCWWK